VTCPSIARAACPTVTSGRRGGRREAYVPTQHPSPCTQARLPGPYEHPVRARHLEGSSRQGPLASVGLIWRIRERDAFARLGREGSRIRTSSLWCTYLPDPAVVPPRVAFAIGRAVGPAVARNRLRRRLRALLTSELEPPPGWYLIGARPSANELTFDQLRNELTALLSKSVKTLTTMAPATATAATTTPSRSGRPALPR
jgi:ribonuclease P protein component